MHYPFRCALRSCWKQDNLGEVRTALPCFFPLLEQPAHARASNASIKGVRISITTLIWGTYDAGIIAESSRSVQLLCFHCHVIPHYIYHLYRSTPSIKTHFGYTVSSSPRDGSIPSCHPEPLQQNGALFVHRCNGILPVSFLPIPGSPPCTC